MKPLILQVIRLAFLSAIAIAVGHAWGKHSVPVLGPGHLVLAISPKDDRLSWVQNNTDCVLTNLQCVESNGDWRITFQTTR